MSLALPLPEALSTNTLMRLPVVVHPLTLPTPCACCTPLPPSEVRLVARALLPVRRHHYISSRSSSPFGVSSQACLLLGCVHGKLKTIASTPTTKIYIWRCNKDFWSIYELAKQIEGGSVKTLNRVIPSARCIPHNHEDLVILAPRIEC
jgi:hypothetical protein